MCFIEPDLHGQEKTKKILANKAELVGFQQTAITAKQVAEELEYSCVKLDEVNFQLAVYRLVIGTCTHMHTHDG